MHIYFVFRLLGVVCSCSFIFEAVLLIRVLFKLNFNHDFSLFTLEHLRTGLESCEATQVLRCMSGGQPPHDYAAG